MSSIRRAILLLVVVVGTRTTGAAPDPTSWIHLPIDSKPFQKAMPLTTFLETVQKQLPKGTKLTFHIDKEAFKNKFDAIAATPIMFPNTSNLTLGKVLDLVASKVACDYRLDTDAIAFTTQERAQSTVEYDLRDLVAKPLALNMTEAAFRNADASQKAGILVKRLLSVVEEPGRGIQESMQIQNGTRLVVRTTGSRHVRLAEGLQMLRWRADLAVVVSVKLYEVDDAFYTKLKNAKYVPLDELEQQLTFGKLPKDSLFDLLPKQKLLQTGDKVKADSGHRVSLLSRQEVIRCLPSPEQLRRGNGDRQTAFEGAAFSSLLGVSPDRRYVRLKFTERATTVEVLKETVRIGDEKPRDAETADTRDSTQMRELVIPDGGSLLAAVEYRPRSAQEAKRWWVLAITARIVIEEEERIIKKGK